MKTATCRACQLQTVCHVAVSDVQCHRCTETLTCHYVTSVDVRDMCERVSTCVKCRHDACVGVCDGCTERLDETTFMYLTCDLPAPPLYPDEMRENIIPQVPLFGILNKFNGLTEKEYKTYKDSTLKRFEITRLPPFIILYIKVDTLGGAQ